MVLSLRLMTCGIDEDEDEGDEACPHPEQECCEDCPFYSECWEFDDEDNDEEPDFSELMEGILEVCQEYGGELRIPKV